MRGVKQNSPVPSTHIYWPPFIALFSLLPWCEHGKWHNRTCYSFYTRSGKVCTVRGRVIIIALRWRHNGRDSVSHHQPHDCLLNRLFRHRSKKTSKLRVTGLCAGNSQGQVNSPHKWPVTRKMFPFDDVIMECCATTSFKAGQFALAKWHFMQQQTSCRAISPIYGQR